MGIFWLQCLYMYEFWGFQLDTGHDECEWFTLDDIEPVDSEGDTLWCVSVGSPGHEFLIGDGLVPTHNTDEAKEANALKGEAATLIGSIARLGRAAGVHLVIATQRPDAKLIPGELKSNLGARMACGHMQPIASSMVLDSASATKTPGSPKGRAIYSCYGSEAKMQVYFAEQSWIDHWLASRGVNPDGTKLSTGPSSSIVTDNLIDTVSGDEYDETIGMNNDEEIRTTRAEQARIQAEHERKIAEMKARGEEVGNEAVNMSRHVTDASAANNENNDGNANDAFTDDSWTGIDRPVFKDSSGTASHDPLDDWDDTMNALLDEDMDPTSDEFAHEDTEKYGDSYIGEGDNY